VLLDRRSHATDIDLQVTPGRYALAFWSGDVAVARSTLEATRDARMTVPVAPVARDEGFDEVSLLPLAGDDGRSLTYFDLTAPP